MKADLKKQIFEDLNNAVANGFEKLLRGSPLRVAEDLMRCSTTVEGEKIEDVCEAVKQWQKLNRKPCDHSLYDFQKHGRTCPCGKLMTDFGD